MTDLDGNHVHVPESEVYMVHHGYVFPRFFASRESAEAWIAANPRPEAWRDEGPVEGFWRIEERELVA